MAQSQGAKVGYSTISERHARQMQHLLLRFGVIAKLSEVLSDDESADRQSWRLEIEETQSFSSSRSDDVNLAPRFNAREADNTLLVASATHAPTVGLNPRLNSGRRSATKNRFAQRAKDLGD